MLPLKGTLEVTESRARSMDSGGSFSHARDGWSVVHSIRQGAVASVMVSGHDAKLAQYTSMLEVTVGDGP